MNLRPQHGMRLRQLTLSLVMLAAALLFATTALANGEPKNQHPFTAKVAQTTNIAPDWFERYAAAHPYGRGLNAPSAAFSTGEPKNELPFTRLATRIIPAPDWFVRYAAAHPYGSNLSTSASTTPIPMSGGFHWRDALIGATAAASLALLCAALLAVNRSRRRDHLAPVIGA